MFFLTIRNSFEGAFIRQGGKIKTSKPDFENHGLGLRNIEVCAEKYFGRTEIKNQMRITTQMVNEAARKAGIPVNNTSLLDYVRQGNSQNSMLEALSSKTSAKTDSGNRKKYEKLEK